jgi:hypothetical protein
MKSEIACFRGIFWQWLTFEHLIDKIHTRVVVLRQKRLFQKKGNRCSTWRILYLKLLSLSQIKVRKSHLCSNVRAFISCPVMVVLDQ